MLGNILVSQGYPQAERVTTKDAVPSQPPRPEVKTRRRESLFPLNVPGVCLSLLCPDIDSHQNPWLPCPFSLPGFTDPLLGTHMSSLFCYKGSSHQMQGLPGAIQYHLFSIPFIQPCLLRPFVPDKFTLTNPGGEEVTFIFMDYQLPIIA